MSQKYLFICGCPRSGTTALVRLLNSSPAIGIGMERYKYYANKQDINKINQDLFKPESFLDLKDEQTNIKWSKFYAELEPKYKSQIKYKGDKYPHYYRFYNQINEAFKDVKWIHIVRNIDSVAKSYNARAIDGKDIWPREADYRKAVAHWNESLVKTWEYQKKQVDPKLFVCEYEKIFSYDFDYLNSLLNFLEVDFHPNVEAYFSNMKREWETKQRSNTKSKNVLDRMQIRYISENAKHTLKNKLVEKFSKDVRVGV